MLKKNIQVILIFFLFFDVNSKEIECQGAKLRIINKITTEKNFFIIPLSQTLELDNAKDKALSLHKTFKQLGKYFIYIFSSVCHIPNFLTS